MRFTRTTSGCRALLRIASTKMHRANGLNAEIRLDFIHCEAFRLYISKVLYYKVNTTQLLVNSIRQPALQPIALPSVLPVNAITVKQPASKRGRLLFSLFVY